MKFLKQIRSNIIAGIFLFIPLLITLLILFKLFEWVDSALPNVLGVEWATGLGITVTLFIAYFLGILAKNYFGKKLIDTANAILSNIPLLNKIYLGVQQIVETVSLQNKKLFDRVVLVEYPKKDCYSIAFVTSNDNRDFSGKTGQDLIAVFVPTTPNPTSGFLIYYPKEDVIELEMPVEVAIKRVMSAGLLNGEQLFPSTPKTWEWGKFFKRDTGTILKKQD